MIPLKKHTIQISENLVHQLIDYLERQPDATAKMLRDRLRYCLELHQEAFSHPESTGVYHVEPATPGWSAIEEGLQD